MSSNGAKGCFPVENTFPAIPFSPYVLYVKGFDVAPLKTTRLWGESPGGPSSMCKIFRAYFREIFFESNFVKATRRTIRSVYGMVCGPKLLKKKLAANERSPSTRTQFPPLEQLPSNSQPLDFTTPACKITRIITLVFISWRILKIH